MEKKLATEVEALKAKYPEAEIELWCEDEQTLEDSLTLRYRLGLKPVLRRVYVPEGENPIANVNWQFKWLWLYAFVRPQTGETYWWILPYVNTELFNQVLEDFDREFKLGAKKRVLLAIDQAGWHISCIVKSSFYD